MKKNLTKLFFISLFALVIFSPLVAFAQLGPGPGDCDIDPNADGCVGLESSTQTTSTCSSTGLGKLICETHKILNTIVPVLVALGVVYFVWGVVQYVISDGEEAKKKGRDRMIFGIIGLAVIIGMWGLVNIVVSTFGLSASAPSVSSLTGTISTTTDASACSSHEGLGKLICQVHQILNTIVPVLVALGVVYFVWGVVRYVIADGEEAKKKGKDSMIYGIIGFAVIIGLWGLVNIVVSTFGLGATAPTLEPLTGSDSGSGCGSLGKDPKFQDLLCYITNIISNSIIPLIFAIATAMFVWGVVQFFIINSGEEAKRAQGRQFMIWGIVALAVMLSVWGLVGILGSTFGIDGSVLPHVNPPKN